MKWRLILLLPFLCGLGLSLAGCAVVEKDRRPEAPSEVRVVRVLMERAFAYEDQGQYCKALDAYEAALTVLVAKKKDLESSLHTSAQRHYRRGLALREKGKYGEARHEFLVALRLWPDYPEVVALLQPAERPRYTRYLVHTVQDGESLTGIAKKYYHDHSKFDVIARFNNLEDAAKLLPGTRLKIPEAEGATLRYPEKSEETILGQESAEQIARQEPEAGDASGVQGCIYDPVAVYEEQGVSLLQDGRYLAALSEFQKVLNSDPGRTRIRRYMALAHYQQGVVLLEQDEYLKASRHFNEALSLDRQCTSCREYLKRSEDAYKETHYRKGIEYFEKQKLEKAIEEWLLVKEFEPDYKKLQAYLLRARNLLDKIQRLKDEL
ncbi:MAG: tetratricopeptide repeat protein [Syntrophobacteria bacterium]